MSFSYYEILNNIQIKNKNNKNTYQYKLKQNWQFVRILLTYSQDPQQFAEMGVMIQNQQVKLMDEILELIEILILEVNVELLMDHIKQHLKGLYHQLLIHLF